MHDQIFIEDVLAACWKSVETPFTTPEILNIGSGIQHPNEAVIELVQEITGEEILLTQSEYPPSPPDTTFWQADNTLARARLGWHPEYSLKEGLIETIAWFKKHLTHYA
jgi:nucleoside-diphosphate-sugar epimerase